MPRNDPFVPTGRKTRGITLATTVENGGLFSIDPYRDRKINSTFGMSRMPIGRANPESSLSNKTTTKKAPR